METRRITVLSAGLGVPSSSRLLADQLAASAERQLAAAGYAAEIEVVELRDLAVDIANNFVTGYAAPKLAEVIAGVEASDGIIAVSPVFSASYSGLFKSFIDVLDPKSLEGKAVLLGATAGTDRHQMVLDFAMRPLFTYLRTRIASHRRLCRSPGLGQQRRRRLAPVHADRPGGGGVRRAAAGHPAAAEAGRPGVAAVRTAARRHFGPALTLAGRPANASGNSRVVVRDMKCPVDSIDLIMSERSGVEIDYCPQCRGVWLDRGELDKILDRAAETMGPAVSAPPPAPPASDDARPHSAAALQPGPAPGRPAAG